MKTTDILEQHQIPYTFYSYSALDRYFKRQASGVQFISIRGTLVDLARVVPELDFPGIDGVDAAVNENDGRVYFRCLDPGETAERASFPVLDLEYDPLGRKFLDPHGVYEQLRRTELPAPRTAGGPLLATIDAALLVSRYHYESPELPPLDHELSTLTAEQQRSMMRMMFAAPFPWKGLALLNERGVMERLWPELVPMNSTDQSKGFHPEGNVWEHSLETLRYRKTYDLVLSLALFLHDCGKPYSKKKGEKRFDGHAEIGADLAGKLLTRMGFGPETREDVYFLIRNHMIPGALDTLPIVRTERLMASTLFPVLLELYRCDLSSTYRGPDGYYKACRIYRAFLKNVRNPFRGSDGKKLVHLYVE